MPMRIMNLILSTTINRLKRPKRAKIPGKKRIRNKFQIGFLINFPIDAPLYLSLQYYDPSIVIYVYYRDRDDCTIKNFVHVWFNDTSFMDATV